jgi:MFS family permease
MMILRSPGMAPTMIASLTVLVAVDMLMVYLPALGEEAGWAPSTVGALLAVRAGASMVSRLGLGQMSDRVGRTGLLVGSMALAAGAIVALPLVGGLGAAFAFMAVAGFALGLGQPLTVSAVAAQSLPGARGTALSVRMMGNRFGQVAVPVAAGLVAGVAGAGGVLALTGVAVGVSTALVAGSSGWSRGRAAGPGSGTVAPSADPEPSAGG